MWRRGSRRASQIAHGTRNSPTAPKMIAGVRGSRSPLSRECRTEATSILQQVEDAERPSKRRDEAEAGRPAPSFLDQLARTLETDLGGIVVCRPQPLLQVIRDDDPGHLI